jgi:hypothetical protein
LNITQHYIGTLTQQLLSGCRTDAARTSCNHRNLVSYATHIPVSLFVFFISRLALSVHTPKTKEALTMSASQIM